MKNRSKNKVCIILIVGIILMGGATYSYSAKSKELEATLINTSEIVEGTEKETEEVGYSDIIEYISKSDKTILVLGQKGCQNCQKYLPLLKETSEIYNFKYLYIDVKSLSKEDYDSLLKSESILVPTKCSNTGKDKNLSDGFTTPLTLFYENGNVYDCIGGYVEKEELINDLKTAEIIE